MRSFLLTVIATVSFTFLLNAQNLNLGFSRLIGGNSLDDGNAICIASGGDIIMAGRTQSTTNGFNSTGMDVLVARYDSLGNLRWKKNINGPNTEIASGIDATEDDGCVLAGYVEYGYPRFRELLLIRLDKDGNILWRKEYGGDGHDEGTCIKRSLDGGYFIGGESTTTGSHGGWDAWITKIDNSGNLLWQKFVGGSRWDFVRGLVVTPGNGVVFCGSAESSDGDFPGGVLKRDAYVAELDNSGSLLWTKKYGGLDDDYFHCIMRNSDGTYSLAGESFSHELFGQSYPSQGGTSNSWLYKVSSTGNLIWWKGYTHSQSSTINTIVSFGSSYILLGSGLGIRGGFDVFMLQCDANGNLQSSQVWGGNCSDGIRDAKIMGNGNIFATGYTCSEDGDVVGKDGDYDALLLRIDRENKIGGSVYIDNNKNDFKDPDEQLLYYGEVQLSGQNGLFSSQLNNGMFSISPISTGNFSASIVPGAPAYTISAASASISIPNFYTNRTIELPLVGDPLVMPSGASPVSGNINSRLRLDNAPNSYNGSTYVQRHYDIEPENNPTQATATVTLYFSQEDFNRFNATPDHGASLPASPSDQAGIANIRIHQYHGFNATGSPADYGGTMVVINPDDNKIVWNASTQWWEITFNVNGFSGFFLTSVQTATLPAKLISFTGRNVNGKTVLAWTTAEEMNVKNFELERSAGATTFKTIATLAAKGNSTSITNYSFTQTGVADGEYFYRLKIIDKDGAYEYSSTIKVRVQKGDLEITVTPNPSTGLVVVHYPKTSNNSVVSIIDMSGRVVKKIRTENNSNEITVNLRTVTSGVYKIIWSNGIETLQKSVQVK